MSKFWQGIPPFGRLFLALIGFVIVGAAVADVVLFVLPDRTAQLVGVVLGLGVYAYLAISAKRVL